MRILFVTSTRIGDAVLSTGLLAHLMARHPSARFWVACGPEAAGLFGASPQVERVIPVVKKPLSLHWVGLWAKTVLRPWSMVVDLRSSTLGWFLLAKERRVFRSSPELVHRVVQLSRLFGLKEPASPRLWFRSRHEDAARKLVPPGSPVLALAPTANWRGKEWPAENFVKLAERLTHAGAPLAGARIAIFGGASEREAALPVINAFPAERRIDLVGRTDILSAAACIARCAFFVGNDSGLMHIAAATGVPTLGLFGPSRVEHYAPWGPRTATVSTAIPYDNLFPPGYDHRTTGTLMESLSVDAAEAAAVELWRRVRGAAA
jgi:ADP-heptose:LPS heptosyltransferase